MKIASNATIADHMLSVLMRLILKNRLNELKNVNDKKMPQSQSNAF